MPNTLSSAFLFSSSSIFVQLMIPAPYLTSETALELIAKIIFPLFDFDFSIFLTLLMYSFVLRSFISSCFTLSASNILRCFYPIFLNILHRLSIMHTFPSFLTTFPLYMINTPIFGNPNSILMSSKNIDLCFSQSFRSSISSK